MVSMSEGDANIDIGNAFKTICPFPCPAKLVYICRCGVLGMMDARAEGDQSDGRQLLVIQGGIRSYCSFQPTGLLFRRYMLTPDFTPLCHIRGFYKPYVVKDLSQKWFKRNTIYIFYPVARNIRIVMAPGAYLSERILSR